MLASAIPPNFPIPFAASAGSGYIRTVPVTTSTPGAASLTLGFPPATFVPPASGGTPPSGLDINGITNWLSACCQWQQAGGWPSYDSGFSATINGYPQGAILAATVGFGFWISLADNNTSNPDANGANWFALTRIRLTGTTNFYANMNGTGTGLSSDSPMAIQNLVNMLQNNYDRNGQGVIINLAAGTYSSTSGPIISISGDFFGGVEGSSVGSVTIQGVSGSPSAVVFSVNDGINVPAVYASGAAAFSLASVTITSQGDGITAGDGARVGYQNIVFGACGGVHVRSYGASATTFMTGPITISGGAVAHVFADGGTCRLGNFAVTLTGTPSFGTGTSGFAYANILGLVDAYGEPSFSGAATGQKYFADLNGVINTFSGFAGFPGTVAGATANGGQYV